jgi:ABC-type hemin transport system substrate-binding protein
VEQDEAIMAQRPAALLNMVLIVNIQVAQDLDQDGVETIQVSKIELQEELLDQVQGIAAQVQDPEVEDLENNFYSYILLLA